MERLLAQVVGNLDLGRPQDARLRNNQPASPPMQPGTALLAEPTQRVNLGAPAAANGNRVALQPSFTAVKQPEVDLLHVARVHSLGAGANVAPTIILGGLVSCGPAPAVCALEDAAAQGFEGRQVAREDADLRLDGEPDGQRAAVPKEVALLAEVAQVDSAYDSRRAGEEAHCEDSEERPFLAAVHLEPVEQRNLRTNKRRC